ncbi:MAG TPA: WD40 repeat domain-containing protein [Phycisphaerae bacterium]|nr:WD40 repeat domain-containing protein [Phycisphaerae bacterium]
MRIHAHVVVAVIAVLGGRCRALNLQPAYFFKVSPDGKMLATNLGGGPTLSLVDLATGKVVRGLNTVSAEDQRYMDDAMPMIITLGFVQGIWFSPDGRYVACAVESRSAEALVWDLKQADPKPLQLKGQQWSSCTALWYLSDSRYIVTLMDSYPNGDNYLRAWDLQSGKETWTLNLTMAGAISTQLEGKDVVVVDMAQYGHPLIRGYDGVTGRIVEVPRENAAPATQAAPPALTATAEGTQVVVKSSAGERRLQAADRVERVMVRDKLVIAAMNQGLQVWDGTTCKWLYDVGDPRPQATEGLFSQPAQPTTPPTGTSTNGARR